MLVDTFNFQGEGEILDTWLLSRRRIASIFKVLHYKDYVPYMPYILPPSRAWKIAGRAEGLNMHGWYFMVCKIFLLFLCHLIIKSTLTKKQ